jgi:hypothetical protein
MELTRRFIFHGNAVAIGGRVVRPDDIFIDPKSASALPVTGGRTTGTLKSMRFGKYVRVTSGSTLAEGVFDGRKQVVALSNRKVRQEELTTTTTVRAELNGVEVGIGPEFTATRIRASLISKSPPSAEGETMLRLGNDVTIDGVAIDGHKLAIELNKEPFQKHDTYSALKGAGEGLVLVESRGIIHSTIVRSIRWRGKPFPGSTIDGHVVTIPEFGRIYFGELLISRDSRSLTMVRLELGSPWGGDAALVWVDDNGSWSP